MPSLVVSILAVFLVFGIFMGGAIAMIVFPIQPPLVSSSQINETPTKIITIYGGEINTTTYGFGLGPNNLTSPGPTLTLKITDVVKLTFVNAGKIPHGFAVTDAPKSGSTNLFGAAVGSASNPLSPGQDGVVVFKPTAVGDAFYYICPVPGHAELGMWGHVSVTS